MIINSNLLIILRYQSFVYFCNNCCSFATSHVYNMIFMCVRFTYHLYLSTLFKHFIQIKFINYLLQVIFNGDLSSPFIVNSAAFPNFFGTIFEADHCELATIIL
jgi:hypothetical protein